MWPKKHLKDPSTTIQHDFCGRFSFTFLIHLLDISLNPLVGYGKYCVSLSAKHMRAHLKCFDFVFCLNLCRNA
jgi:hypothetical protein